MNHEAAIVPAHPADLQALEAAQLAPWMPGANPAAAYIESLAAGASRMSMRSTLDKIAQLAGFVDAEAFPWENLTAAHVHVLRARLAERYAPATANKALAAIRGVLKAAWRLGQIDTDTYMRASDVPSVKGQRLPAGRALTTGEALALFRACEADRSPAGARDAAAFALMYGAGLRRSEVAGLQLAEYDPDSGEIRLVGKGNKERKVYAVNGGQAAISEWLRHRGTDAGPLLQPVNKSGEVDHSRGITAQALMYRLKLRCQQAGIAPCSPHDLRRSFVSELLDAGADIAAVKTLAGHASTDTTARYDRRGERAAQRAAAMVHVPYSPPALLPLV